MEDWVFLPDQNRIESADQVASLTPKATAVLEMLAQNHDKVVSPSQILSEVWEGVHVTPDLVREYIFDIRKALGDDAKNPKYIETVRGKGFKLVGPVSIRHSSATDAARRPRIGVLRPTLLAGEPTWQQYIDATAEELVTDLARFSDLSVMARSSSFAIDKSKGARAIGRELGCTYLIDSSFSIIEHTFSAHVQLIEAETGSIAWAEKEERSLEQLASFPGQWALAVANMIGGTSGRLLRSERAFATRRPMSSFGAYELYALACNCEHGFDPESENKALAYIDLAIKHDAEFARSHVIRSLLCSRMHRHRTEMPRSYWQSEARKSIDTAYRLDRYDALILACRGLQCACDGELDIAKDMVASAIDRSLNQADAAVLCATASIFVLGDVAAASKLLDQAYSLNTEPPGWYDFAKLRCEFFRGNYAEAESIGAVCEQTLVTRIFRCLAQNKIGSVSEARNTYTLILAASPEFDFFDFASEFGIVAASVRSKYEAAAKEFMDTL